MAISIRDRFEVLKRDAFTCRYCGAKSPDVVLEIDHIVPVCEGGSDDPINLATACWDCNRGKSGVPIETSMIGEDPHERSIRILEQERQVREYNNVLRIARERQEADAWELVSFWTNDPACESFNRRDLAWLINTLAWLPAEQIREFMRIAISRGAISDLRYVKGCVRNLRNLREEAAI